MQLNVVVTQDDINNGIRRDCTACPVAVATARALNDPNVFVAVDRKGIYFNGNRVHLPKNVESFVTAFDAGWANHLTPIKFTIHVAETKRMHRLQAV
jgi:hypothetical protein